MKIVSIIVLVFCLLQPLVCFADSSDSYMGSSDLVDAGDVALSHTHSPDAEGFEEADGCAGYTHQTYLTQMCYSPLASVNVMPEYELKLPTVVIPILQPPQNC